METQFEQKLSYRLLEGSYVFTGTLNVDFLLQGKHSVHCTYLQSGLTITGHGAKSTLHQRRSNAIKYFSCCTISNQRTAAVFETFFYYDTPTSSPCNLKK